MKNCVVITTICLLRSPSQASHQVAMYRWFALASFCQDQEDALRKRLLHRSRQRGMLEVDLLLGKWAKLNVFAIWISFIPQINRLNRQELDQYEALLNSETVDIFSWITDKSPLPPVDVDCILVIARKWTCRLCEKFNSGLKASRSVLRVLRNTRRIKSSSPIGVFV